MSLNPELAFSVSACTRQPRANEVDGRDYHFISLEEFEQKIREEAFIEWEEVYEGTFYGSLQSEIDRIWAQGQTVIFDVDVEGGVNLKQHFGEHALAIFVKAPSEEILRNRLEQRGTDGPEEIERRIRKARHEESFADKFDYIVVNDELISAGYNFQRLYTGFVGQNQPSD